jgi:hypothetical protein
MPKQECDCRAREFGNITIEFKNYTKRFRAFGTTCGFMFSQFAEHVDAATVLPISGNRQEFHELDFTCVSTRFVTVFLFSPDNPNQTRIRVHIVNTHHTESRKSPLKPAKYAEPHISL